MGRDDIVSLYAERGHAAYVGEGITQLQHAWQCGLLARQAGAAPPLQLAAWLHDIGHLVAGFEGSPTLRGINDAHERRAAEVLAPAFGPSVAEPVALHVLAKRCLVTLQPGYRDRLSPDSIRSLALQGGKLSCDEAEAFLALPAGRDALRLRVWDDNAKNPALCFASPECVLVEMRAVIAQAVSSR
jgi:predicted HD phosphohydrolase